MLRGAGAWQTLPKAGTGRPAGRSARLCRCRGTSPLTAGSSSRPLRAAQQRPGSRRGSGAALEEASGDEAPPARSQHPERPTDGLGTEPGGRGENVPGPRPRLEGLDVTRGGGPGSGQREALSSEPGWSPHSPPGSLGTLRKAHAAGLRAFLRQAVPSPGLSAASCPPARAAPPPRPGRARWPGPPGPLLLSAQRLAGWPPWGKWMLREVS